MNRISTVLVGGNSVAAAPFRFRNVPRFLTRVGEYVGHPPGTDSGWHGVLSPYLYRFSTSDKSWTARMEYEVEALLTHLHNHDNTAPFVATRLIQRLVTSNPSTRYVRSVSTAFRTGAHAGVTYSGRYGCLAATVAAILLDREARNPILDSDPGYAKACLICT